MAVRCEFNNSVYGYYCLIQNQEVPSEVSEKTFQGVHEENRTNDDVRRLIIENSKVEMIPDKIGEVFKNVTELFIMNSKLKEIWKENLQQFPNLVILCLSDNLLEYLPVDLFEFNKKLEEIWFRNNKIKFIEPELLDGLQSLTLVSLENNQNINSRYSMIVPSLSLNQLKDEIKSKCKPPLELFLERMKKLQNTIIAGRHQDLDKFLALDDFKDFTIKVGSKDFKVHKLIFMARSPTFAEMIKNNPDADELVLTDITVEVFESILEFVYTDQLPKDSKNAREIFAAAGKLKIESLKILMAEIMIKKMEGDQDLDLLLDYLNLGAKFSSQQVKLKAFEEIKKHFQEGELDDELIEDPEKLKMIIEAKKVILQFVKKKYVGGNRE